MVCPYAVWCPSYPPQCRGFAEAGEGHSEAGSSSLGLARGRRDAQSESLGSHFHRDTEYGSSDRISHGYTYKRQQHAEGAGDTAWQRQQQHKLHAIARGRGRRRRAQGRGRPGGRHNGTATRGRPKAHAIFPVRSRRPSTAARCTQRQQRDSGSYDTASQVTLRAFGRGAPRRARYRAEHSRTSHQNLTHTDSYHTLLECY
jgi:hypothetical protein